MKICNANLNMFSKKIWISLYKKVKVKEMLFDFFLFFIFLSLFLTFFFCLLLYEEICSWLASWISNSKSPWWSFVEFHSKFFLVIVSRIVCYFFSFDCELMVNYLKTIRPIWTFARSEDFLFLQLTEIQYF